MKVLVLAVLILASMAQAPALSPEAQAIVKDLIERDRAMSLAESIAMEAVKRTPEYKQLAQVQSMRKQAQGDIAKRVSVAAPGFLLNFQSYQLEPAKP